MQVGDVVQIKTDNGSTTYAKIVARPPRKVTYKTRKNNRGRWTTEKVTVTLKEFKELVA